MRYVKNILDVRPGSVKNRIRKRRPTRLQIENLEERWVQTAVLSTGMATALAAPALVSTPNPTSTTATTASPTANVTALVSTAVPASASASPVANLVMPPIGPPAPPLPIQPGPVPGLTAPTLTAVGVSTTEIDLSWTAVPAASGYRVYLDMGEGQAQIANLGPGSTSDHFNCVPNVRYWFWVVAYNASDQATSNSVLASGIPQVASVGAKAVSAGEIDLTWTQVSGAWSPLTGIGTYTVEEYVTNTVSGNLTLVGKTSIQGTSDHVTGLSPATTYSFRVVALTAQGLTTSSNYASALTFPAPPTVTATTASTSEIDLAWNTIAGATGGYQVDQVLPNGTKMPITTLAQGNTTYPVKGLNAATTYSFTVGASNASGTSFSPVVGATTLPVAPSLTTATPKSANEVDLTWTAVFGAATYQVQYSSNNGASWTNAPGTTMSSEPITGLLPATNYEFRVNASDAGGASSWSNSLNALTFPAAPTLTATAVSTHEIDLTWPGVFGATNGYVVFENGKQIPSPAAGSTYDPITGLTPGEVFVPGGASNASGTSLSIVVSATTFPATPYTITVHSSATTITAGTALGVTITALDESGEPCNNVSVTLNSSNTGQNWSVPISNGTGTLNLTTLTKAGTVTLTASYGSFHGATNVSVTPAAPMLTVSGLPTTMTVKQAATVTVTVADRYGNAYGNTSVTIGDSASSNLFVSAASLKTNSSGQASVVATAVHSGAVNGVKANLTFSATAPCQLLPAPRSIPRFSRSSPLWMPSLWMRTAVTHSTSPICFRRRNRPWPVWKPTSRILRGSGRTMWRPTTTTRPATTWSASPTIPATLA